MNSTVLRKNLDENAIRMIVGDTIAGRSMRHLGKDLGCGPWVIKGVLNNLDKYPFLTKKERKLALQAHNNKPAVKSQRGKKRVTKKEAATNATIKDTGPDVIKEILTFMAACSRYIDAAYRLRKITGSTELADQLFEGALAKRRG